MASDRPVLEIDGATFDDFEGFVDVVSALLDDWTWNGSLDAFNDILRGGVGAPEEGFILRWRNADRSREVLGYAETERFLERKLSRCHSSNRPAVRAELDAARGCEGATLFDVIVQIIRAHGPGAAEAEDLVTLEID